MDFYPRPPRGGRRECPQLHQGVFPISIHALREEGDAGIAGRDIGHTDFYPRPPRGGRRIYYGLEIPDLKFLSTPSARRATLGLTPPYCCMSNFYPRPPRGGRPYHPVTPHPDRPISIHALREEGDQGNTAALSVTTIFLSTPSARRATRRSQHRQKVGQFLSTPSARRATFHLTSLGFCFIKFLSTPSARRATCSAW